MTIESVHIGHDYVHKGNGHTYTVKGAITVKLNGQWHENALVCYVRKSEDRLFGRTPENFLERFDRVKR